MREFIIWSNELKEFSDSLTLKELLKDVCENWDVYEVEECDYFEYIGISDITNRKIYAGSSIVEFINDNDNEVYQGYFKYDEYHQRMFLWFFEPIKNNNPFGYSGKNMERVEYLPNIMRSLKIIDTIQENKLGLIK